MVPRVRSTIKKLTNRIQVNNEHDISLINSFHTLKDDSYQIRVLVGYVSFQKRFFQNLILKNWDYSQNMEIIKCIFYSDNYSV